MNRQLETLQNQNDELFFKLKPESQQYISKMMRYLRSKGVGMPEAELIRKDLIGLARETELTGESIEERVGNTKEFAENLAIEGCTVTKRERGYKVLERTGFYLILTAVMMGVLFGRYDKEFPASLLVWNLIFCMIHMVCCFGVENYSMWEKGMKKHLGDMVFLVIIILTYAVYSFCKDKLSGHMLPAEVLWGVLFVGILCFAAGKLLLFQYRRKTHKTQQAD